ncbi:hypothetical protein RB195_005022 [Necator americanus]|uniref:ISXO2-like transposase domain-containing protein n=1 Tax=Necator americanus TaxID=51031 RepID=A0ABR1BP54_NECAM
MRIVRRKYNVGRIVRNHWVVGDIQIGMNLVFVDVMDDGSSANLFAVIQKYVQRDVACTDIWRGYNDLTMWVTPKKRSTPCELRGSDHRSAYAMHRKRLVSLEGSNSLRAPVKH